MTSASELFHISRRSRIGVGSRNASIPDLAEPERSFHHRRHHGNNNTSRFRHDLETVCDPLRRRVPRHHHHNNNNNNSVSVHEHDTVQIDEGSGQFSFRNNSTILNNSSDVGNRGRRHIANETLPGSVLLARERLVERLRGVSLSANRRNNRASLRSNRNGLVIGDANEDHWDTETLRETLGRALYTDLIDQNDQLPVTTCKKRPPGLTQNALNHLQLEIFTSYEDEELKMLGASQECSICLESFAEGDELVCLTCAHKFHFVCLEPWVRTCGDCPYCRREVVVSFS